MDARSSPSLGADHLTLHDANIGQGTGAARRLQSGGRTILSLDRLTRGHRNIIVCPYARGSSLTSVDMAKLLSAGATKRPPRSDRVAQMTTSAPTCPTPAARDGRLYLVRRQRARSGDRPRTGKTLWELDLPKNRNQYSSSPLVTASHLYLTREDGQVFVIALAEQGANRKSSREQFRGRRPIHRRQPRAARWRSAVPHPQPIDPRRRLSCVGG